jgi:hypothetical protein
MAGQEPRVGCLGEDLLGQAWTECVGAVGKQRTNHVSSLSSKTQPTITAWTLRLLVPHSPPALGDTSEDPSGSCKQGWGGCPWCTGLRKRAAYARFTGPA